MSVGSLSDATQDAAATGDLSFSPGPIADIRAVGAPGLLPEAVGAALDLATDQAGGQRITPRTVDRFGGAHAGFGRHAISLMGLERDPLAHLTSQSRKSRIVGLPEILEFQVVRHIGLYTRSDEKICHRFPQGDEAFENRSERQYLWMTCDNPRMAKLIAGTLRKAIADELDGLLTISEEASRCPRAAGQWTPKEELGHLIDSAANNHMRFVRAALDGAYEGPGYEQNGWVDLHGYKDLSWAGLVEFWRRYNELLAQVVERIPDVRLQSPCRIGGGETVTLGFVIDDYVRHLKHHLGQIVQGATKSA